MIPPQRLAQFAGVAVCLVVGVFIFGSSETPAMRMDETKALAATNVFKLNADQIACLERWAEQLDSHSTVNEVISSLPWSDAAVFTQMVQERKDGGARDPKYIKPIEEASFVKPGEFQITQVVPMLSGKLAIETTGCSKFNGAWVVVTYDYH